jgi:hypothetical protein
MQVFSPVPDRNAEAAARQAKSPPGLAENDILVHGCCLLCLDVLTRAPVAGISPSSLLLTLRLEPACTTGLMLLCTFPQFKGSDMVDPTMENTKPMYLSRDDLSALWPLEEKLQNGTEGCISV